MLHRALALVLALTLASDLIASSALAGGDERAIALDLFEQGRTLFKEGNYQGALAKFDAAAKVMRTFGILLNVAECQEKLGRTASAWATWREARAVAAQAHSDDDEAMATVRQKALEAALSRLTIVVPSDSDAPELEIRRDGGVVPREAWGAAIAVDPGAHVIDARAPGRTAPEIRGRRAAKRRQSLRNYYRAGRGVTATRPAANDRGGASVHPPRTNRRQVRLRVGATCRRVDPRRCWTRGRRRWHWHRSRRAEHT